VLYNGKVHNDLRLKECCCDPRTTIFTTEDVLTAREISDIFNRTETNIKNVDYA